MKRVILGLFLILCLAVSGFSQGPPLLSRTFTFTSTGNSTDILVPAGVDYFKLTFNSTATPATCNVSLTGGQDGSTYGTTVIAGATCTSDGFTAVTAANTGNFTHIRVQMGTYTVGGTTNVTLDGWKEVTGASGGASPTQVRIQDGSTGNLLGLDPTTKGVYVGITGSAGDAEPNSTIGFINNSATGLFVNSSVYNGSTWDRLRSAGGASGTTGTGLAGSGNMSFDGTNWQPFPTGPNSNSDSSNVPGVAIPSTTGVDAALLAQVTSLVGTVTNFKASAGNLFGYSIYNPAATACFVQFFPVTSGSVTLGSSTPSFSIGLGTLQSLNVMSVLALMHGTTGMSFASTTTSTGATPCTVASIVNVFFK